MKGLKKGDTIALLNLGAIPPKRFHHQILLIEKYLIEQGYNVINYLDFSEELEICDRVKNLHMCFLNDDITAIFPISDGNMSTDFLRYIDYDLIKTHPKIICGYSGLSLLIFMITYNTGVPTFYGPHINFINGYSSQRENMFTTYSFWNLFQKQAIGKGRMNLLEKRHFFVQPQESNELRFLNIYSSSIELKHKFINCFCKNQFISGILYVSTLEAFSELLSVQTINMREDFILMLDVFEQTFEEIEKDIKKIVDNLDMEFCKCIYISTITYKNAEHNDINEYKNKIMDFLNHISINILPPNVDLLYGFPVGHSRYKLTMPTGVHATINSETGDILMKSFL